jgi:hypothetical protein
VRARNRATRVFTGDSQYQGGGGYLFNGEEYARSCILPDSSKELFFRQIWDEGNLGQAGELQTSVRFLSILKAQPKLV